MTNSISKLTPISKKKTPLNETHLASNPPNDDAINSTICNLEQDIFNQLISPTDMTTAASFLQAPLPPGLEKVLIDTFKATPQVLHLFVVNHLITLRSIAQFGDRTLPDIFAEFPVRTVLHPAFQDFMIIVHTLTLLTKQLAQAEMATDTPLQVNNNDSYFAYLPDEAVETDEYCARFITADMENNGHAGFNEWYTEFEKQVEMARIKQVTDPHLGRTIHNLSSGGGSNTSNTSHQHSLTKSEDTSKTSKSTKTKRSRNKKRSKKRKTKKNTPSINSEKTTKTKPSAQLNIDPHKHEEKDNIKFQNLNTPLKFVVESDSEDEYLHPKRAALPASVQWDGEISKFLPYKKQVIGHFIQIGAGYLFDTEFQELWKKHKDNCLLHYNTNTEPELNIAQMKMDIKLLYGALISSLTNMTGNDHLLVHQDEQDGLSAWLDITEEFDQEGSKNLRIMKLEEIISTSYYTHYKGGLAQFVSDYKNAYAELTTLGETHWNIDETKKQRLVNNLAPLGFHWLTAAAETMSFMEVVKILKEIALLDEAPVMEEE